MHKRGVEVRPDDQGTVGILANAGYQVDFDLVPRALIDPAMAAAGAPAGDAAPIGEVPSAPQRQEAAAAPDRVLLFAGHMIDKPTRAEPRFPAAQEATARQAIREAIAQAQARWPGSTRALGIAGGASGGDILFHEVCAELGIPTALYLALPPADYIAESVQVDPTIDADPGWIARFHAIRQRCEAAGHCHRLEGGKAPPDDSLWERNNQWMLESALAYGADKLTLLVLWDGRGGDAPGGTQHMVDVAGAAGATVQRLDTRALFGLP